MYLAELSDLQRHHYGSGLSKCLSVYAVYVLGSFKSFYTDKWLESFCIGKWFKSLLSNLWQPGSNIKGTFRHFVTSVIVRPGSQYDTSAI